MSHESHAAPEREYVLGTSQDELTRLGFQHSVWRAQACALWERAGFAPGHTILDVGAGPGFATQDLARLVGPGGRVIAADISQRFIEHLTESTRRLGLENVTPVLRDVQDLDIEKESVDGAYVRWVLSFVPDPERVVRGVARALRPGAVFAMQEYVAYSSMRLAPPSAACERVVRAVIESWRLRGGNSDVGLVLPGILERAGLSVRELTPISRVARPGSALWQWPEGFFKNYVPTLVASGLLTEDEQRAFFLDWNARARDPDAFFLSPLVLDVIAVKR
ncbi:methyltransferase domain-containing protein [bacterium]|nr:methyltransferase domain-containing protein [bacterium]